MIKTNSLPPNIISILKNKETELPFTGKYNNNYTSDILGTYLCRQCGIALFRSSDKFTSSCGWPSFDSEIKLNIKKIIDQDKIRTEILCARCNAHLGHIFHGEQLTEKNTRYCVNSLALDFIPNNTTILDTEEVILAAGCFWGVEYLLNQTHGVLFTEVGYTGSDYENPSYQAVCAGTTRHVEAVRVVYDPIIINYKNLLQFFFEIHDFTQSNGQDPDIGDQYLSKIFYYNQQQLFDAKNIIDYLKKQSFDVVTALQPVSVFWAAEAYHQNYYTKNNQQPYCHSIQNIQWSNT